jgi:hypothetical protein
MVTYLEEKLERLSTPDQQHINKSALSRTIVRGSSASTSDTDFSGMCRVLSFLRTSIRLGSTWGPPARGHRHPMLEDPHRRPKPGDGHLRYLGILV